jgi:reactive intermediate/imine deaminase|tara:strand:- start:3774 stop:4163 length:390 start_codon:yes stop_codon:yes gene_type:complete
VTHKIVIQTNNAPAAIGPYSQAIKAGNTVYISGQIPLDPTTMQMETGDIQAQTRRVFNNIAAIASAAGGSFEHMVKLNISVTDLANFAAVNQVMEEYCSQPFPARACVGVASLPKDAEVEIEAIMVVDD